MRKLTYQELLSPYPIYLDGICCVKPPTLESIFKLGVNEFSQSKYEGFIQTISMDVRSFFKVTGNEDQFNTFDDEVKTSLSSFDIWTLSKENQSVLIDSLSFFVHGDIKFSCDTNQFLVYDPGTLTVTGAINKSNFDDLCDAIKQLNYIDSSEKAETKLKNEKAVELFNKLNSGNNPFKEKKQTDEDINIPNIISALCVQHNSYNMTNIWALTVYQLYDQFFRQNIQNQINISTFQWGVGSLLEKQEPFDFSLWFKSMENKATK